MRKRFSALRGLTRAACVTGMLLAGAAHAQTGRPMALFTADSVGPNVQLPAEAIEGRSRAVRINYGSLRSGRFSLNLPGDIPFEAVRDLRQEVAQGKYAWVGHAEGDRDSRVVIGVSGNAVAGSFVYQGRLFTLEPRADGSHILSEVDPGDPAPEHEPIPVADTSGSDAAGDTVIGSGDATATATDGGPVLDVMVAYTPKVESLFGTEGIEARIIQAVAEANEAYANSGIPARLNLVHTVLTDYTESGNMNTDLSRLRGQGDGYMDELHSLRDAYGADLVSLIENEPQYCGIAYLMTSQSTGFASSAFSVVHRGCVTGRRTFAHEIGHNQGAHHDTANAGAAIFPHAYGYQEPFGSFRTVMAYNCPGGCQQINYFSSPEAIYNGQPTGILGAADNVLTINSTAATVANFRQPATVTPPSPPSAPEALSAVAMGHSTAQLDWTDTSGEESGFYVERSADGATFTQIAVLSSNATSLLDDNLSAETSYSYRVRAWNSAGNSSYSNVASVTTSEAPPSADHTAISDIPVRGTVSGTYQDTWVADGQSQVIREEVNNKGTTSLLVHRWSFTVQPGDTVTFVADVHTSAEDEAFMFHYTTPEIRWTPMFDVDSATSGVHEFTLPAGLSGPVEVRVRDKVRTSGLLTSHSVNIDRLVIRSTSGAVVPVAPTAPDGLTAAAGGESNVQLGWLDLSDNEAGFGVERRVDGSSQWSSVGSTGSGSTSFTDQGLQAGTLYHYRVFAFNDAGESGRSNNASARTDEPAAGGIELSARGYKKKGRQRADLDWSGASSAAVDIYRDGARIAASMNNSGSYTDNINKKGGGSYSYKVCEAGTGACSNTVNVVF